MISVSEAINLIRTNIKPNDPVEVALDESAGNILADDVHALHDIPGFDQSAMDGYAYRYDDRNDPLKILDEIPAGDIQLKKLQEKTAARIFTGAPVPQGADTVVMQEKVHVDNGILVISDEKIERGRNVRKKGTEIRAGDIALNKGSLLTPGAIGFIAGAGIDKLKIYPCPTVGVIVTGNELVPPGTSPVHGNVFESNSFALKAVLHQAGVSEINTEHVSDDPEALKRILKLSLKKYDMVLLTGGVSVGKYDFVQQAASNCGVQQLFHKVKQKPGKPLYFGMFQNIPVFGLPGNPSSVLTCFYEYAIPAIESMTARRNIMKTVTAVIATPFEKPAGLSHFLKGYYKNGRVQMLGAQESYRMSSFARANSLIFIPEEVTHVREGDTVEVHLLPD